MLITFGLLALAIGAIWMPPVRVARHRLAPALVLGVAATGAGVWHGYLDWRAVAAIGVFALATYGWSASRKPIARALCAVPASVLALALALHALPGFDNPTLIDWTQLSDGARPYRLVLKFDYAVVGLVLGALVSRRAQNAGEWAQCIKVAAVAVPLGLLVVLPMGIASEYFAWAPKLTVVVLLHLAVNLPFTYVAEETFFRGAVQEPLHRAVANRHALRWLPVVVATALFGITHLGRGWQLIVLAAGAGAALAFAYERTRRVEAPILTHLGINTVHVLLFTFPALSASP